MRFSKNKHLKTNTGICTGRARHEQTHDHKSHLFPLLSSHKGSKSSADLSIFISHYDKTLFLPKLGSRVCVCWCTWSGLVIDGCVCACRTCVGIRERAQQPWMRKIFAVNFYLYFYHKSFPEISRPSSERYAGEAANMSCSTSSGSPQRGSHEN